MNRFKLVALSIAVAYLVLLSVAVGIDQRPVKRSCKIETPIGSLGGHFLFAT